MGGLDVKLLLKPVGIFAVVLSLIQATLWIILSILAILAYNDQITLGENADEFMEVFFNIYFSKATPTITIKGVTTPDDVLIWMCVYLGFSVIWLVTCIIWLVDLVRANRSPMSLYLWISATSLTLILDLTATIWFATDLASMMTYVTSVTVPYVTTGLLLSSALMMTMAARGFVLYIVNAGLLALIATIAVKQHKRKSAGRTKTHKTAYANPTMNSMWPDISQAESFRGTWNTPTQAAKEGTRYPTFVNPPMSPVYDEMPPRSQPPFILKDPPKPRSIPPPQIEEAPKYTIPEPDYSPLMNRAYKPMLPVRPALKKSPHTGRTVF